MASASAPLSSGQAKARLGEVAKVIVQMAHDHRSPIVIEELDFQKKEAALKETCGPNLARRLSSFAYSLFKAQMISRAARFGVRVIEVDPAFTSHMGRANYATPLGISVHRAAAAMIARRGIESGPRQWIECKAFEVGNPERDLRAKVGLSEGLFASAELPLGDGSHVAVPLPARIEDGRCQAIGRKASKGRNPERE